MRLPWDRPVEEAALGAHWFGRMLTSLYFSTFMIRASFAIMLISFPIYILGLKSYFLFGLVLASSPLFELITVIGLGAYIDKHGRKNVLLVGLLMGSIALFGLLLTKEPVPLFIINAFHGIAAAAILVSSLALIADYAPRASRGKIMGAFDFVNLFGWIVGFGVGGLLIDTFKDNIGMTFVVAGVMGLVAWIWATLNVVEPRKTEHLTSEISFKMIASVLKQRSVVLLIAPWFIIYLLVSTMLTFTSKAGTQELGLTGKDLAVLLGGGGTIFLVTQVAYGWMSDKYGRTKIMIVGTVGIVGIMLTVGGVFLSAPATIAPAAHHLLVVQRDSDIEHEYLLQSDAGLYLLDGDGTVLKEIAPPEGGFGEILPIAGVPTFATHSLVLVGKQSLEVYSLDSDSITWAQASREPRLVHAADIDHDGTPEILFADSQGVHITGPAVPSASPSPPTIPDGSTLLDLDWYNNGLSYPGVLALVESGGSLTLLLNVNGTERSLPVAAGFTSIDRPGGWVLSVSGPGGVARLNESSGNVEGYYPVPPGWRTHWVGYLDLPLPAGPFEEQPRLIAFGPNGRGAVFFREANGSAPSPEIFELPGPFGLGTVHGAGFPVDNLYAFVGFAANGTFVRAEFDVTQSPPQITATHEAVVLVKRETAQATFGKLTSPALLIPLGIFGLMAGAFGPAALAGLTDVSQSDKRGTTMGLYSVVISTSMIVGPITTGFLVDNYGGFGVMMFLVLSAAAMAIFMALRALDVRRQGGEEHMLQAAREKEAAAADASKDQAPAAAKSPEE